MAPNFLSTSVVPTLSSVSIASSTIDYLLDDNQGTLELAKNLRINSRSKYIDVHYHYVRQQFNDSNSEILSLPTVDNRADVITKNLLKPRNPEQTNKC